MSNNAVLSAPLLISGVSCLGPWGGQLCPPYQDPPAPAPALEPVPKFVESSFNPLISLAVRGALSAACQPAVADTGLVLVSSFGDTQTADAASRRLAAGRPINPLLFYQSIPNSILGYLGRELGLTGPIICASAGCRLLSEGLAITDSVLADGAARQVLLIGIDLMPNERIHALHDARTACRVGVEPLPAGDIVAALVVQRQAGRGPGLRLVHESWPVDESRVLARSRCLRPDRSLGPAGSLAGFVELCQVFADLRRGRSPSSAFIHDIDAAGQHHTIYRALNNNE